jgi:hypothetical protein
MNKNSQNNASSEIDLKISDYKIPSNNIFVEHPTAEIPHVTSPSYQLQETNQIFGEINPMTAVIPTDFHDVISNTGVVNDGNSGSYEQFGGNKDGYYLKYLKYKQKYLSLKKELKKKLGSQVPIDQRTIYYNIHFYNKGDINKIKQFFLEPKNHHHIKEIIDKISMIDTYVFNSFKKEEKIVFWIAINLAYLEAIKADKESRVNEIKYIAINFKNWYDDWNTYPNKEIEGLEIIRDLK